MKKVVLIVGGTGGIGRGIVQKFAQNGYDVVATYNSSPTKNIEKICKDCGSNLLTIKMDISDFRSVEQGFDLAFSAMGRIDAVVCNSGISLGEKLLCDFFPQEIDKIVDVNLKGAIYCNREAQKHFINQKYGAIVNVTSIYGLYGGSCESAYSASKGGIVALTKAMAEESGAFGVRVNAVAPGYIKTPMTEGYTDEENRQCIERTPLKRLGTPQDVANAVFFLAGNESSFITGEILTVSGGVLKF